MKTSTIIEELGLKNHPRIFRGSSRIPSDILKHITPITSNNDIATGNHLEDMPEHSLAKLREYCEEFDLDISDFYYIANNNSLIYDSESFRYDNFALNLALTTSCSEEGYNLKSVLQHLKQSDSRMAKLLKERDFRSYLAHYYDQSIYGIEKIIEQIKNNNLVLSDKEKDELLTETVAAFQKNNHSFEKIIPIFEFIYDETLESVLRSKNLLKKLADDNNCIRVYRGSNISSTAVDVSISWTLSLEVAASFAYRHYQKDGDYCLYEGLINIDDCYLFIDNELNILNNTELEVLIRPNKVNIINTYQVANTEQLIKDFSDFTIPETDTTFMELFHHVKQTLLEYIEEYEFDSSVPFFECSDLHGYTHTIRVVLNSLIIAMNIQEEEELTGEEIYAVAAAATFHDVGRIHDDEDMLHGKQSVEKMNNRFPDYLSEFTSSDYYPIIEFIMANHNIPDHMAFQNLKESDDIFAEDKERAWLLYQIVCDGDGLDRVRLGDLDINYLRLPKSKLLVPFAEDILANVK